MILLTAPAEDAEAERLDDALDSLSARPDAVPLVLAPALRELVRLAEEVSAVLAEPLLSAAQRRQLWDRALTSAARRRRPALRLARASRRTVVSRLGRPGAAAATVGGAAAVAVGVAVVAALRGRHHDVAHPALG